MFRHLLPTGLALGALSFLAAAQSPTFTSGPDFYAWPDAAPTGLTKLVAADTTPDDTDDAFALHGSTLYFLHGAGEYPRWEPVASGVADFVVTRRGSADVAVFATGEGLKYAQWIADAMTVSTIAGSPTFAATPRLAACLLSTGDTLIAGVVPGSRVTCGHWTVNGTWSTTSTTQEAKPPTDLAVADFKSAADSSGEVAVIVNGTLAVRTDFGAALPVPGLPTNAGHRIFALRGGGAGGTLDSFIYVTASPVAGSLEAFWEVFPTGVSLPFGTGAWTIRNIVGSKPWSNGRRGVMIQTANTAEIFRLEKWFDVPGVNTILGPTTTNETQAFWWIPVTAVENEGGPVLDGLMACGDFDSDGLDDILVASNANRFSYLFPAVDDEDRFNGVGGIDAIGGTPTGGGDSGTTLSLGFAVTLSTLPDGFTASQPPNALLAIAWVREGGVGTYLNPVPSPRVLQPCTIGQPTTIWVDATTNIAPQDSLVYIMVRPARVDFTTPTPTVLQLGTAVNMMTVMAGSSTASTLLCDVFTNEPDRYSSENRALNGCPNSFGTGNDDGVIIGGFSRRSTVGPFPPGYGSPPGQ